MRFKVYWEALLIYCAIPTPHTWRDLGLFVGILLAPDCQLSIIIELLTGSYCLIDIVELLITLGQLLLDKYSRTFDYFGAVTV